MQVRTPGPARDPAPVPAPVPDAAHFARAQCLNCGAARSTPYCGACGQPAARRLDLGALGGEAWQRWRWFESRPLRTLRALLRRPGAVAREYVLGARTRHAHPLALLLPAIGLLLLVLAQTRYLGAGDDPTRRALALAQQWGNWSFSLGIVAMFVATWTVLRGRAAYNATEHLVLATYCQVLVIGASVLSKLPLLEWREPGWLELHRVGSARLLDAVGALVLAAGCTQFFALDPRRDAARLAAAVATFLVLKWLLLRGYAWLLARWIAIQLP